MLIKLLIGKPNLAKKVDCCSCYGSTTHAGFYLQCLFPRELEHKRVFKHLFDLVVRFALQAISIISGHSDRP